MFDYRCGLVLKAAALLIALNVAPSVWADPVTFRGAVLLSDGKPAAGARVINEIEDPVTGYDLKETTTDAAGKFVLTVEGSVGGAVAALLPGHPLALAAATPGEEITIRFGARSAALTGTVCDQQGKPVAGAQVAASLVQEHAPILSFLLARATGYLLQATTGADGRFSIPDLPPSANVRWVASAPGLAQRLDQVEVGNGDISITLPPEVTVSGRVTCEGKPVPGVCLTCWGSAWRLAVVTGPDGAYRLEHLSGTTGIEFQAVPAGYAAPLFPRLKLHPGDHITGQDFALTPGALLTGKVTVAGTGAPVAGARISCEVRGSNQGGNRCSAQTDATGVYYLHIAPGHGELSTQGAPPDRTYWVGSPDKREVDVAEGVTKQGLDFTLAPPPAVHGQVLRPDGQPAVGARVYLVAGGWAASRRAAVADAAGKFTIELGVDSYTGGNIPGARFQDPLTCVAALPGCALACASAGQNEPVTLHLGANPLAFSGTITDTQGRPLAGVDIGVPYLKLGVPPTDYNVQSVPLSPLTTGADGRFSLPDLPPGTQVMYDLSVAGYTDTHGYALAGTPDFKIVLSPEATISGKITAGGKPLPGVKLWCTGTNQAGGNQNRRAITAADGTYHLYRLGAGQVIVSVDSGWIPPQWSVPFPVQLPLEAGQQLTGQDFVLTPGALLTGKITEAGTGKPVSMVRIEAQLQALPGAQAPPPYWHQYLSPETWTDDNGAFRFRLPAGKWELRPDLTPATRIVEAAEGDQKEGLDFTLALTPPPPHVKGQVLLPDGAPAAGVTVGMSDQYGFWDNPEYQRQRFSTRTGPDGSYDLEVGSRWSEGDHEDAAVVAMKPDQGLIGWAPVRNPALPLEVRLVPGAYLTTQVSDPQDRPLAGVHFPARWSTGDDLSPRITVPEAVSDEQGHVRVGPFPAGQVELHLGEADAPYVVDDAWVQMEENPPVVAAGEQHALPPLHLDRRGRTVSGSVVDADGRPVAGALVECADNPRLAARTDEHGLFTLTGLALHGALSLAAVHPTQDLFAAQTVVPAHEDHPRLVLQPLGDIKGQVVDVKGKPLPGAGVVLSGEHVRWREPVALVLQLQQAVGRPLSAGAPRPDNGQWLLTDAHGRWQIDGVIAGPAYTLRLWSPDAPGDEGHTWIDYPNIQIKPGELIDTGPLVFKPQPEEGEAGPFPPLPGPGAAGPAPKG